jgi:hypothetical protein
MSTSWLFTDPVSIDRLTIRDLLKNSIYYPAAGKDGTPVEYLGKHFASFVFADYDFGEEKVLDALHSQEDGFRGYRVAAQRRVEKRELVPNGWNPVPPLTHDINAGSRQVSMEPPFAIWAILERTADYGQDHGPKRFSLLYIGGEGVATYQALYHGNKTTTSVVCVIQPGTGFGKNWTNFEDEGKIFARTVLDNPYGKPEYLLCGGHGKPEFYETSCWPDQYSIKIASFAPNRVLWQRNY